MDLQTRQDTRRLLPISTPAVKMQNSKSGPFFPQYILFNYGGNNNPGTASPLNACLQKYVKKGNNHLDLIQTVGIVAYPVPHEQQKACWRTAGAGLQGSGCKGIPFNLLAKHIPTRSSTTTKFLSENGSVHATALLSRCIQAVPGLTPCLEKSHPRAPRPLVEDGIPAPR